LDALKGKIFVHKFEENKTFQSRKTFKQELYMQENLALLLNEF
jgi:hypothetical protein